MKAIWTGSISFGLVNIPVKMYSAVESSGKVSFRMLHDEDGGAIKYKRVCSHCNKEVPWSDIAKGVEIKKNHFYKITKEELSELKPEKTETVRIMEFIDVNQLDMLYLDKHYFLGPAKKKDVSYFLLQEVMHLTGKIAIGKFVLHDKEHICAIRAYKNGLLLTTLNYAEEMRDISGVEELKVAPKTLPQELTLARQLIDKYYKKSFKLEDYENTFAEEIKKLLVKKEKGEPIKVKAVKKAKKENLVEALKASLR